MAIVIMTEDRLAVAFFVGSQVALWYTLNVRRLWPHNITQGPYTQIGLQYFLHPGGRSSTVDSSKIAATLEKLGKKGMKLTEHEGANPLLCFHNSQTHLSFPRNYRRANCSS